MRVSPHSKSIIDEVSARDGCVRIRWVDGHLSTYPYRWLRYECTCKECGESITGIRFVTPGDVSGDLSVLACRCDEEGYLVVKWSGAHLSRYDPVWLRQHCLETVGHQPEAHRPIIWGADLAGSLPAVCFDELVNEPARRCDALEAIRDFGLVHVTDGPAQIGTCERIARLIGPLEETNFGRVFDLKATAHSQSIGATQYPASLHTDDCYRNMPTGIKVIHCIQDSDPGTGYSLFADGFFVGERLRQMAPAAFDILCTVPITFHRRYDDAIIVASGRIFSLDSHGRLRGFRFQDRSMAPLSVAPDQVDEILDAIAQLMKMIEDPANQLKLRLAPGEAVLFDNQRLLHGRTGFTGHRHLQLCSVNRDTYLSEMRVLERKLGRPGPYMALSGGAFA